MKRRVPRRLDGAPIFFRLEMGMGASPHPATPHLASPTGATPNHPHDPHPTQPHLTPYRRGCPRRALFRVFDHPKVFALLFAKNASYDLLRAPRGIVAISHR